MLRWGKGPALATLAAASMIGAAVAPAAAGLGTSAPERSAPAAAHASPAAAASGDVSRTSTDRPHAGPPYDFETELMSEHMDLVLRDMVMLTRTEHGYRFWTGNNKNHITVTIVDGKLRFRDPLTKSYKDNKLAKSCQRVRVDRGVAADCRIPDGITHAQPLLVEVWPRLGNDYVDASTMPADISVSVLADGGIDRVKLGAGDDFFNGHTPRDFAWGGAGDDWMRSGAGHDKVWGGPGNDDLVAMQGADLVWAGSGDDRIGGLEGNDTIWGEDGADFMLCGPGRDTANADSSDRVLGDCESVNH